MSTDNRANTGVYLVTATGTIDASGVTVMKVVMFPNANGDDFVLTDNSDNVAISMKGNSGNTDMVELDFGPKGKKLPSLKVGTLDTSVTAEIHFRYEQLP